jgi:hypothetical protein
MTSGESGIDLHEVSLWRRRGMHACLLSSSTALFMETDIPSEGIHEIFRDWDTEA